MNVGKVTLVRIFFLFLAACLAWGVCHTGGQLDELKRRYGELEQAEADWERERKAMLERIAVYKNAFALPEEYNVSAASGGGDFYSQIQNEIRPYIDRGEIRISRTEPTAPKDGRGSISFTLQGNFRSLMRILAAWRGTDTAARVSRFSAAALRDARTAGEIEAGVTLEDLKPLPENFSASPAHGSVQADKARLGEMIRSMAKISAIRKNSIGAVNRLEELYPSSSPFDDDGTPDALLYPIEVIDYPPEGITLRGIMTVGKESVAVMDIPGAGTGMVVRAGDTFMGKGRVTRITPDKAVINWGGRNWDIVQ